MSSQHSPAFTSEKGPAESAKNLPKGVILDKDGKPCRLCTSAASWREMVKRGSSSSSSGSSTTSSGTSTSYSSSSTPGAAAAAGGIFAGAAGLSKLKSIPPIPSQYQECPPDVEGLGRSTWTFLHSLTATYPTTATPDQQSQMRSFLSLFSRLYPCWVCADDFREWVDRPDGRNQPRLSSRAEFGTWMCEAHNEVNRKLGKPEFDCRFWEERWRTGWKDGRCD